MTNCAPQNDATAAAVGRDLWLVELPASIRANDERCRATAARLLDHAPIRSVSIDRHRRKALVRTRAGDRSNANVAELQTAILRAAGAAAHANEGSATTILSWTDTATQTACYIRLPAAARGWRKIALLMAAVVTLFLGLLGIVLPGLPTTPFVLLASVCLLRSSPKLHERLLTSRLFGGVLRDWHLHRGVRPHVRYKAIFVIALVVAASLLLTTLPLAAKLAIAGIAAFGIAYVWRLPDVVAYLPEGDAIATTSSPRS